MYIIHITHPLHITSTNELKKHIVIALFYHDHGYNTSSNPSTSTSKSSQHKLSTTTTTTPQPRVIIKHKQEHTTATSSKHKPLSQDHTTSVNNQANNTQA